MYQLDKFVTKLSFLISQQDYKCVGCGRDIFPPDVAFCDRCTKLVSFNKDETCKKCGCPVLQNDYCPSCQEDKIYFDKGYSVFVYQSAIRETIYDIKFGGQKDLCCQLSTYLAGMIVAYNLDFDLVSFVPMTAKAIKKRGFNQSKLLAEFMCDILEIDVCKELLAKVKDTEPQEKLRREERMKNMEGAFKVVDKELVAGKKILLIDDVKTTGATLSQCSKMLKLAGATEVDILTVCATAEYHQKGRFKSKVKATI